MTDPAALVVDITRHLRQSPGYAALGVAERSALERDLGRIQRVLQGGGMRTMDATPADDPYWGLGVASASSPLAYAAATPADLQREISGGGSARGGAPPDDGGRAAPSAAPPPPPATQVIGERAADVLEAVDFPGFVAGLVTGTFQAIVDATKEQIREYADLVADLSRSVDDFASDRVTDNQARDWLAERHPKELRLLLPEPGTGRTPQVLPQSSAEGSSPAWLDQYGLSGQPLTADLTEGDLLRAARRSVGEQRMQSLATMVLLGINRVVVRDGHIRAKMQFHAAAVDRRNAEIQNLVAAQQGGIAGRPIGNAGAAGTMVSTVKANAQADAAVRADLMGEVNIRFESETFPLERFADSAAIQLINRHARWQAETPSPQPRRESSEGGGAT